MSDTITFTVTNPLPVTGARQRRYEWDLSRLSREQVEGLLDYAFGAITQRAGAGKQGQEKFQAEEAMAKKLLAGEWYPGHGGGGARLSLEERAARSVFEALFRGEAMKAADAEKAARSKDRLETLAAMIWRRETGADPSETDLQGAIKALEPKVQVLIQEEAERLRRLQEAPANLSILG